MTKKIPIEFGDHSKVDWRVIWNILHRREFKLMSYDEAHLQLQSYLSELDSATILYVASRNGYELKRYL